MSYLPEKLYQTVTKNIPIVCIDLVPVRRHMSDWQIGIVTRATGPETGKPALLGGRVYYKESIVAAVSRNLQTDLGIKDFKLVESNDEQHPFYVQQYWPDTSAEAPFGYDPTKHAISLVYLIELGQTPKPKNEASNFYWITQDRVPKTSAYNHHFVMHEAFKYLLAKGQ